MRYQSLILNRLKSQQIKYTDNCDVFLQCDGTNWFLMGIFIAEIVGHYFLRFQKTGKLEFESNLQCKLNSRVKPEEKLGVNFINIAFFHSLAVSCRLFCSKLKGIIIIRVYFMFFADGEEGIDHGGTLSSFMGSREQVIFPPQVIKSF